MNKGFFKNQKFHLPSVLVVFLVALPLCLGIVSTIGTQFFNGFISGIVGGIVVAGVNNSVLSFGAGVWKKQKIDSGYIKEKLVCNHNHRR